MSEKIGKYEIQRLCEAGEGKTREDVGVNYFLSPEDESNKIFSTRTELARYLSHLDVRQVNRAIAAVESGISGLEGDTGATCLIALNTLKQKLERATADAAKQRAGLAAGVAPVPPVLVVAPPVVQVTPPLPVPEKLQPTVAETVPMNLDTMKSAKLTGFFHTSPYTTRAVKSVAAIIADTLADPKKAVQFNAVRSMIDQLISDTPPTGMGIRTIQNQLGVTADGRIGTDTVQALLLRAGVGVTQIPRTLKDKHKKDWNIEKQAGRVATKSSPVRLISEKPVVAAKEDRKLSNFGPNVARAIVEAGKDNSPLHIFRTDFVWLYGNNLKDIEYAFYKVNDGYLIFDKPTPQDTRLVYKQDDHKELIGVMEVGKNTKPQLIAGRSFQADYMPKVTLEKKRK